MLNNLTSAAIILNYNTSNDTERLAKILDQIKAIDEIIIVDNASSDDSFLHLSSTKFSSKVRLVSSGRNGGYSFGNNFGASQAILKKPDLLFFINPDVIIDPKSFEKIIQSFSISDYSVLTCVEKDSNLKVVSGQIQRRNSYFDDVIECFHFGRKLIREKNTSNINFSVEIEPTEMIRGSFWAIRTQDFLEIGKLDENVFLFSEERILSVKCSEKKKKIGLVTNAYFIHMHSVSINSTYKKRKQLKFVHDTCLYFNKTYYKISKMAYFFLWLATRISLLSFSIASVLKKPFQKNTQKKNSPI